MKEPCLVILAAGMGSRFGGLKQITPMDDRGHAIIDFSLFDAYRAGFRKVVFIIKHEIEDDFKAAVGTRMEKYFDVRYVFQQIDMLPSGYCVPANRVKPWGTGHAVLCAANAIDGPFAVINADDYYGRDAFSVIYNHLKNMTDDTRHAMVAYRLKNTVTEHGHVARGICETANGFLTGVNERTHIEKRGSDAAYTEDGVNFTPLSGEVNVSMNFWGFGESLLTELKDRFPAWLDANLPVNPEKAEYFLPFVANAVIQENKGTIAVLECGEKWYGVTYKEDMPGVIAAIAEMKKAGKYPEVLLD